MEGIERHSSTRARSQDRSMSPSSFSHPFDYPTCGASSASTNLFEDLNILHDLFYARGFVESAGNFQTNNFGLGGVGNDAVEGTVRAGCRNNASFGAVSDGTPG